jgi:pyridoxine 5-phosphate synthase
LIGSDNILGLGDMSMNDSIRGHSPVRKTELSVNMNVAGLLRNRRDHPWPSVVDLGRIALEVGAIGLTVHPRPDERHTRSSDVRDLRALIDDAFPGCELNVEGYPDERFLALVREVRAEQVTLVPDSPDQATSDHGWDFVGERGRLSNVVASLKANGHRVALFADPEADQMADASAIGADRVELYTGPYGATHSNPVARERELERLENAVATAREHGLGVNAGHDLTVANTAALVERIPAIAEVSIGHALFCDSLTYGMKETVRRYLSACAGGMSPI